MADGVTVYMIEAPPDSTLQDVARITVEAYLNEEHPPENIVVEAVGVSPNGQGVWSVTVPDPPESAQEARTGDPGGDEGDSPTHLPEYGVGP